MRELCKGSWLTKEEIEKITSNSDLAVTDSALASIEKFGGEYLQNVFQGAIMRLGEKQVLKTCEEALFLSEFN